MNTQQPHPEATEIVPVRANNPESSGIIPNLTLVMSNGWKIKLVSGWNTLLSYWMNYTPTNDCRLSGTIGLVGGSQFSLMIVTMRRAKYMPYQFAVQAPLMPQFYYTIFITLSSNSSGDRKTLKLLAGMDSFAVNGALFVFIDENDADPTISK